MRAAHSARRMGPATLWLVTLALTVVVGCHQDPAPSRSKRPASSAAAAAAETSPAAAAVDGPAFPTLLPPAERVVAIGDLHGDLAATRAALELGGVLADGDRWSGGRTVVVQTGDVLDRGDEERAILELLERVDQQARAVGGRIHVLNGNHELMNVAGDLRYVTPGGFQDFATVAKPAADDELLPGAPEHWRPRVAAFRPGGPYARKLADHPVVLQIGPTLFAHGGIRADHVRYGLERINRESRAWLIGKSLRGRRLVARRDSPVWERTWSGPAEQVSCRGLAQMLKLARADRLVVGHTPQEKGITSACDKRVWRIDVGLASFYQGPMEVLEITADGVKPLRGERPQQTSPAP